MNAQVKAAYRKIVFHGVKVPSVFFLIVLGYIIEFFINLPFILITFIDGLSQKKAWRRGLRNPAAQKHPEEKEQ